MVVICAGCPLDAAPGPKIEPRSAVIGSFALGDVLDVPGSVTLGDVTLGSGPTDTVDGEPENGALVLGVGAAIGVTGTLTSPGSIVTLAPELPPE